MKTSKFNYYLPPELIAQRPVRSRDSSKLLVLNKKTGQIKHDLFLNLVNYLQAGDTLVLNNSKVFPAKMIGQKMTGGKVEILLVKEIKSNYWECLLKGRVNTQLNQQQNKIMLYIENRKNKKNQLFLNLIKKISNGKWLIQFSQKGKKLREIIYKIGQAPIPPYIKRISNLKDYQTIYAQRVGSIAAPTAGFHFTQKLFNSLKKKGVKIKFITLHVGLGTFLPVKTKKIDEHQMLSEEVSIDNETVFSLNKTKKKGGRIIAVGTSTVRALESTVKNGKFHSFYGPTNLFIKPGYKFSSFNKKFGLKNKMIDGLITNFHLPKSTNLVLVSQFAGKKNIDLAYQKAIEKKYRFYSFGDAMLIF